MVWRRNALIGLISFGFGAVGAALIWLDHRAPQLTFSNQSSLTATLSPEIPVTSLASLNQPPSLAKTSPAEPPVITADTTPSPLPTAAYLDNVPFIPQAPHQLWDEIHKETCEEAAVLTVAAYLRGDRDLNADAIDRELLAIIDWEQAQLGVYVDTTVAQTAQILREYYGYGNRVRVEEIDSLDDIRREVADGRPVIVPTAGRLLNNRYFQNPGPIYHMVVVIGYDRDTMTTHDPGTRRGNRYQYTNAILWNAIHDFVDHSAEGMATGVKRMIIIDI